MLIDADAELTARLAAGVGRRDRCMLAVSDRFQGGCRQRIEDEALTAATTRMGSRLLY